MPARNYTTKVGVTKTIAEIQAILAKHGANAIAVTYTDRKPSGLRFQMPHPTGDRAYYDLPVDVAAMQALLTEQRKTSTAVDNRPEQAERVAWRVMKDWLDAQLALIAARQATMDVVMLPYLVTGDGRTLGQVYTTKALEAAE